MTFGNLKAAVTLAPKPDYEKAAIDINSFCSFTNHNNFSNRFIFLHQAR
jgi:hypothetical protein